MAELSYDEKLQNKASDLPPPIAGKDAAIGRDHEYIRHARVSLLAGMTCCRARFSQLARITLWDARIRIVLDNHSALNLVESFFGKMAPRPCCAESELPRPTS